MGLILGQRFSNTDDDDDDNDDDSDDSDSDDMVMIVNRMKIRRGVSGGRIWWVSETTTKHQTSYKAIASQWQ
jgi:hypothetical protein